MTMRTLVLLLLTFFVGIVVGSVKLIQLGGWLAILSAILILIHYFLTFAFIIILMSAEEIKKKKIEEETRSEYRR